MFAGERSENRAVAAFRALDKSVQKLLAEMYVDMTKDAAEKLSVIKAAGMLDKINATGDGGVSYKTGEYWHPAMTKTEIAEVRSIAKNEANKTDNYLGIDAKWLYNKEKGHEYFAIYSTMDSKVPTVMYACKDNRAKTHYDHLMDIVQRRENIRGSIDTDAGIAGRLLGNIRGITGGNFQHPGSVMGTGGNNGNASVHSRNRRARLDQAFINCLRNIEEVQQQYGLDDHYQFAVDRNDMKTAQRMVDEAAREAGYPIRAWHGTPIKGITVFDPKKIGSTTDDGIFGSGFYFTTNKITADGYASDTGATMPVFLRGRKPWWGLGHSVQEVAKLLDLDESILTVRKTALGSIVAPLPKYARIFSAHLTQRGYDSVIIQHGANNYEIVVFDNTMIKSADPVTYDDDGNVIPLSQRFNPESDDIRYSLAKGGVDAEDIAVPTKVTEPEGDVSFKVSISDSSATDEEVQVGKQVADFIEQVNAMANKAKRSKRKRKIGKLSDHHVALINSIMRGQYPGFDASGYTLWVDGTFAVHIEERHGAHGAADKTMATRDAKILIPWAAQNATTGYFLHKDGHQKYSDRYFNADHSKAPEIRTETIIGDDIFYVTECVPDSANKIVWITSAYIAKGSTGQLLNMEESSPQPTPEATFDSSATENSVPQPGTIVKQNSSTDSDWETGNKLPVGTSSRVALVDALEGLARRDEEKRLVNTYRTYIKNAQADQDRLVKTRKEIARLRKEGDPNKRIPKLQQAGSQLKRMNIAKNLHISVEVFVFALPIFPGSHPPSIVGVHELNFCVRDGNRWTLMTINTNSFSVAFYHLYIQSPSEL